MNKENHDLIWRIKGDIKYYSFDSFMQAENEVKDQVNL